MRDSFLTCINAVIPTCLIMLLGYFAKSAGIIKREDTFKFNAVIFKVFFPVMLFKNIYNSDLSSALNVKLAAFVVAGIIAELLIAFLITSLSTDITDRKGVMIQGMFRANTVVVGLPIAMGLLGENADIGSVVISLAICVPIFNIGAVTVLQLYSGEKVEFKKMLLAILKNPLIIGTLIGIIFKLLDIKLPESILSTINSMGSAASPMALFLIGAFFTFDNIRSCKKELITVCLARLILFPAIFLPLGMLIGFRNAEFVALITIFASSNATSSFTMAQQMGGDADLAGSIVVITSVLCPVTMFAWSLLFKILGCY